MLLHVWKMPFMYTVFIYLKLHQSHEVKCFDGIAIHLLYHNLTTRKYLRHIRGTFPVFRPHRTILGLHINNI